MVHENLLLNCRSVLRLLSRVRSKHRLRKANKCADLLTRKGTEMLEDFVVYANPPVDIGLALFYDALGMYYDWPWPVSVSPSYPKKRSKIWYMYNTVR